MTTRTEAPTGAPCWADLWTSDIEGSRHFYGELFGWEANEPDPQFGGYFIFTRNGVDVAGCMGDMGPMQATDTWKPYLATTDIAATAAAAEAEGAELLGPVMPVGDIGIQAVLNDPTGAHVGAWQALTFAGFTVLDEPGTPSWFELLTRDHAAAVAFYRTVFGWETDVVSDTDEFRYTTVRGPGGAGHELAGVGDASGFLPEGVPSHWSIYWHVDDVDAALAAVQSLGGSVVRAGEDTPYGRLAEAADPAGAHFKLRTPPA